jgi:hypothetical protein
MAQDQEAHNLNVGITIRRVSQWRDGGHSQAHSFFYRLKCLSFA